MANRLDQAFAGGRKLLCPFLTAGYPTLAATPALLLAAQAGGAGVLELGIPFSDPVADGPVVQASYTHALAGGTTVKGSLEAASIARQQGLTVPVVAMARSSRIDRQTQLSCNSLQGAAVGNRRYGGCQAAGGRVDRTIMRQ